MAMIPTYQDMLAQALQQSQQQQQAQRQSTQNRSIFDNPAFGNSLMKMGLTMLADSEQGYSLGESIGRGGLAFMQERQAQEAQERALRAQEAEAARQQLQDNLVMMKQKREAMLYDTAAQQAQGLSPEYRAYAQIDPTGALQKSLMDSLARQQDERNFAQQKELQNMQYGQQRALAEYNARQGGGMGDMPAAVKEYLYYNQLPEDQRKDYLSVKRADPYQTAFARAQGMEQGALQMDAPTIQQNSQYMIDTIERLEKSPGFDAIFGSPFSYKKLLKGGMGAGGVVPVGGWGSDAANAYSTREQVLGQAFVEVYDRLRGAGNIAITEGDKGQQAFANLRAAQTPEEARKNLEIIKNVLKKGLDNLNKKLNMPAPQFPNQSPLMSTVPNTQSFAPSGTISNPRTFNPRTGRVE